MAKSTTDKPAHAPRAVKHDENVDPNTTVAIGDPYAGVPAKPNEGGDADLKAAYDKLAQQTSEASASGDVAEVAKLKAKKLKAFQEWNASKAAAEQADKERARRRGA